MSHYNVTILFLQELVKKYSEFINFPIHLWASKEVDVEVPTDEEDSTEEESCMQALFKFPFHILLQSLVLIAETN